MLVQIAAEFSCFQMYKLMPLFFHAEQLLEFMHQLPAFANMTMSVRRELCAVMVFAVVERAGTIVLNDGEEVCIFISIC